MAPSEYLHQLLKKHFGHDEFRPHQIDIIQSLLAGKDVFAVLPTGAGKSLCFQLPAVVCDGLTLVISPLIALMKDQVDALNENGIPATSLNSSIPRAELAERYDRLGRGEYKLLYAAPERAVMPDFIERLKHLNIAILAIDEAHCISEWGHDFRPEYQMLAKLRAHLPQVPVLAVTATATERVRKDIVNHLELREPETFLASFNRPNLTYGVVGKSKAELQVLGFIKKRPNSSGIVYCLSRAGTESLAEALRRAGISALPYHAGLTPTERGKNQEKFLRDDVQVICATIAFGMGINKSNVRFVIHYDLPKNVEGYYQETGRAGRDGLHSECLLLYSRGDMMKLIRFIDQISGAEEKKIARNQLNQMIALAEAPSCRRAFMLNYFGEKFPYPNCGGCDNCLDPAAVVDATLEARKFLSCVFRVHQLSNFGVGLKWIANILQGESTPAIQKHRHETLSTFGIAKDVPEHRLMDVGGELLRRGYLSQSEDQFATLTITDKGRIFLRSNEKLSLAARREQVSKKIAASRDAEYDQELFDSLRALRKQIADERNVPAFVVFADSSLQDMARKYPRSLESFKDIAGVGDKKAAEFGGTFTKVIQEFLQTNQPKQFAPAQPVRPPARQIRTSAFSSDVLPSTFRANQGTGSAEESLKLFLAGKSVEQIAEERNLTPGTVYEHLVRSAATGATIPLDRFFSEPEVELLKKEFATHTTPALKPIFEKFNGQFDYGKLRLFREVLKPSASLETKP
ncbi:MAG: DNA helicase RecQ [Verrucomicrobiales bacterium]